MGENLKKCPAFAENNSSKTLQNGAGADKGEITTKMTISKDKVHLENFYQRMSTVTLN